MHRLVVSLVILCAGFDWALAETAPRVGKNAAAKYMGTERAPASSSREHYLNIHLGTYVDDAAYNWGQSGKQSDVGGLNVGVTYRVGEWTNAMDLLVRADFTSYDLNAGHALKMSLLPVVTFPDATSHFPLYFGVGAGLGIFFK